MSQKLKIKDVFEKLKTLRKTLMPLLMTIFDSLYENFPKLFFIAKNEFFFDVIFKQKIRQKSKIKDLFAKLRPWERRR